MKNFQCLRNNVGMKYIDHSIDHMPASRLIWRLGRPKMYRARKSRTTLQNKVRLKVLPEQLTLFVNTSVTFKKCIIQ